MSLEKEIKDFLNSSYGTKNIRGDYTTNSQSYYDFLEKVIAVLIFMSKKIDEYDGVLTSELQKLKNTLDEYLEKWDENLENFDASVLILLQEWMDDGTFEHIINHEIFQNKLDTSIFEQFEILVNRQLQELEERQISVERFGAVGDGVTDDTLAIQDAIQYVRDHVSTFPGKSAGAAFYTLLFPKANGTYRITAPLDIGSYMRMEGNRTTIKSEADWVIAGSGGLYDSLQGWQFIAKGMIFSGKNGIRLNTRITEGGMNNVDFANILLEDCSFFNEKQSILADVQSSIFNIRKCLIEGTMDIHADTLVLDSVWSNWRTYNQPDSVQEFLKTRGRCHITDSMFIPYAGANADNAKEMAWIGHYGILLVVDGQSNFGGEQSGIGAINYKSPMQRDTNRPVNGVILKDSNMGAAGRPVITLFEFPQYMNIENNRSVITGGFIVGESKELTNTKIDDFISALNEPRAKTTLSWTVKNNGFNLWESTNIRRSSFSKKIAQIAMVLANRNPYFNKTLVLNNHYNDTYFTTSQIKKTEGGNLWFYIRPYYFPQIDYNRETNGFFNTIKSFKLRVIVRNNEIVAGAEWRVNTDNIIDYDCYVTSSDTPGNQSIRFIERSFFTSNAVNTRGKILDATVALSRNGVTTEYPADSITGNAYGKLDYIKFRLDGVTDSTEGLTIILEDVFSDEMAMLDS